MVLNTVLHYVCIYIYILYIQLELYNSLCGLCKDSQCMWTDWLLKSGKMALTNCNETRNPCIYIRFCSLAVFVLWAHIIGSVGYWGYASSLLRNTCAAITATAGKDVQSDRIKQQLVTLKKIIVLFVTECWANTSKNYLCNRSSSRIRQAQHLIWKGRTVPLKKGSLNEFLALSVPN
jgi:hypothetical protein